MSAPQFVKFRSATPNPQIPSVHDIACDEVATLKSSVVIVDVRRPDEWTGEYGHIDTAQLIVLDTLPMHLEELPKDKTIVFVCRSGARSAQAAAFAQENGYTSVYNMRGGMIDWTNRNLTAVEKNS
jgi:rhodanese-related sulfurtransferase